MPIDLKIYPSNWKSIAKACKDKANWKCEQCGIAHGELRIGVNDRLYKVVLTAAHVGENKHNKMDCSNLKALCQRCHLREDKDDHVANRKRNRRYKKLQIQPELPFKE